MIWKRIICFFRGHKWTTTVYRDETDMRYDVAYCLCSRCKMDFYDTE